MKVKGVFPAVALSLLIHGLLAVGLVAYLEYAPAPDVPVALDLSSVELSFAETEDAAAAVSQTMPAPADPEPTRPAELEPPALQPIRPNPPDPAFPKLRDPIPPPQLPQLPQTAQLPQPSPRQARIDAPPLPRRAIKPDYPRGARQRGEQGNVVLEIRVTAEGTVETVKVVLSSGFPELDAAAVQAAKAAKFSPAKSGRDPVASSARLQLQFKLK